MTDPEKPPLDDLLSNFALGPAWARGEDERKDKRSSNKKGGGKRVRDKRGDKDGEGWQSAKGGGGEKFSKGRRPFKKGGKFDNDKRSGPPSHGKSGPPSHGRDQTPPAKGVHVTILPDAKAVHLIVKEVQQVARVYSMFDIATTILSKRERLRALFESKENMEPMWRSKAGDALFLSKGDAQADLWHSDTRKELLDEETIDVDPPSGNFQAVAKCGLSGKWLGPPNFHTYQTELRRLHRERFAKMPFDAYRAKVRTEHGEQAVNAWLETVSKKTRWRKKGEDGEDAWTDDPAQAKRLISELAFDDRYEATHKAELPASASGHQLSAPLRVSLKLAYNHARKHAAMLIPALCKIIETEHLPVFKRKGKLFTGPVRPQPLPRDATLAARPAQMVEWIRANREQAKLEGLWKAVLPEGSSAPPSEYAADLFWLLQQGHIQLYMDDTLVVMEEREKVEPKKQAPQSSLEKSTQPSQAEATALDDTAAESTAAVDEKPAKQPEKVDQLPEIQEQEGHQGQVG